MTDEVKKTVKPIERVSILECHREKLASLTDQANAAMGGIANINKGDVVNMILGDHAEKLSRLEIERLRAAHVDQVKLALWLAQAARDAKRSGESVSLQELLDRCESALAPKKPRAAPRTRKPRPATSEPTPLQENEPHAR